MTDGSRVAELLDDRPDLESPLAEILAVDEEHDAWTFDDIPVDSGAFGELVGRGVVEKIDGDYRLADPDAVRRALDEADANAADVGATESATDGESDSESVASGEFSTPSADLDADVDFDYRATGLLAGVLAFVVVFRAFNIGSVFRGEHVVLGANDPYYYRYWVEQVLAGNVGLGEFPGAVANGEPFLVATLSVISGLLGGVGASGVVLAVYPVVAALIGGVCLYALTLRLTADRRIALAAVAFLAITPGHALRTALGFADHHAFDYVWLAVTALSLVVLAGVRGREDFSPGTWLAALGLGIGVGGQALAWEAGPLLIVPIGLFVALRVLLDAGAGRSPLVAMAPTLAGLALGALLAVLGHTLLGWHTTAVAFAPVLLLGGAAFVTVVVAGLVRLERSAREILVVEVLAGIVGAAVAWVAVPELSEALGRGLDLLFRSDEIVETQALLSGDTFGFLLLLGFVLVLAVPALIWASREAYEGEVGWLAASVYGWYFLLLAGIQVRFVGELALFTGLFAGVGFVWLAARIDLAVTPPLFDDDIDAEFDRWVPDRPDRSTLAAFVVLFLLVGGLGMVQSAIKVEQVTTGEQRYETAVWMAEYADEQGLETSDEAYVLSNWPDNRMYNYFVNGDSQSYSYARSTYGEFVTATGPDAMYETLRDRAAFVVLGPLNSDEGTMHARLYDHYGSAGDGRVATEHYRAVFASSDGAYKVFRPVSGARITGPAPANSTFELSTTVDVVTDEFTYTREVTTNRHGVYEVRVPYAGEYGGREGRFSIPESVVTGDEHVSRFDGEGMAYWSFDEGDGSRVYDRVGGYHGNVTGADWTRGINGTGLRFDGDSSGPVRVAGIDTPEQFTVSLWVRPANLDVSEENDYRHLVSTGGGSLLILEENGRLSFRLPGVDSERLVVAEPRVSTGEWTHVVATYDGDTQKVFVDGQLAASKSPEGGDVQWQQTLLVGAETQGGEHVFNGTIDEIRISPTASTSSRN